MKIINKYPYCIGHTKKLSEGDIKTLIQFFNEDTQDEFGILSGRGKTAKTMLENNLSVVVKQYLRGGFISRFISRSYLRTKKTRPRLEFEMLQKARDLGVSVPEPVVWASCGGMFYQGWLVTEEIEKSISLADYYLANPDTTEEALLMAVEQVSLMIQNKILHVDLHPGNILFDGKKVFIIDFDKSKITTRDKKYLTNFYIKRWKRAVKKHQLPEKVTTIFEENLKSGQ